jgi:hypothetical protein
MYSLYLDDSGSVANQHEEYFVLAGFCVFENNVYYLRKYLDDLATEINPTNPNEIEFHASEIYAGKNEPWKSMAKQDRLTIIKRVLRAFNSAYNTHIFACAIHKKCFPTKDPVEMAFEDLCSRFEMFLDRLYHESGKEESQRGIIVLDKTSYETSLQKLAIEFRQIGTKWRTLNNIIEVPMFIDSKASRLTQLADHVAYSIFRRYEAGDINYYNLIEGRFDSSEGKIHGLAHKQYYKPDCTCPGCLR